ncbi:hypothetical protein [Brevibacillus agri]|uniref:hypothetical protein n=1 Tax=Brevibacillus agri TaxID=51101 RepID=UPI001EE52F82|nr:hypothetical protein [Brevibacillus agri]MCG5252579.1 hypothetical protein [Brevibacillus agri]
MDDLSRLALSAKRGCRESEEAILRAFLPEINDMVSQNWYMVFNEGSLTKRLTDKLLYTILAFDERKGSFSRLARNNLREGLFEFIRSRKYSRRTVRSLYHKSGHEDDESSSLADTLPDVLANVEDQAIVKEKIALLAKGDSRKEAILLAWSDGLYNDSALSVLLAQRFGGKPESHRQAIKRFRAYCQVSLEGIA